jgi:chaperone required for assembly of F1-ATPase
MASDNDNLEVGRSASAAVRGAPPERPKRFYETVGVAEGEDGRFAVTLDGKPVRTPSRRPLAAPSRALAQALAAEWERQGERLDPSTMPLTRLANSAIDGVAEQMAEVEADVAKYARSDLVSYRAAEPAALAAAQARAWDPLIAFARGRLGADLVATEGIVFVDQPQAAAEAVARAVRAYAGDDAAAPFRLAALHAMTTLTGSCVIALAVALGEIGVEDAWRAAHVDEDFQIEAWGADAEAQERRRRRLDEMTAAALLAGSACEPA